jgi:heat shock protein HtpX
MPGYLKLRLSILGTLALLIGFSTLAFTVILSLFGAFDIVGLMLLVVIFNLAQWLFAPYLLQALYRVREVGPNEYSQLQDSVRSLSQKLRMKTPKLMVANIPIPNAFAYGSPLTGSRVAVTSGLLRTLDAGEVEAVIGHELGHIKHRDVGVMMFASILPAIFYYIGFTLMWSGMLSGGRDRRGNGGLAALIGFGAMAIHFILTLFVLQISRLREYYADRTSAENIINGPDKLSQGLARIVVSTGRYAKGGARGAQIKSFSSFKALLIADPDRAGEESAVFGDWQSGKELVQEILSKEVTTVDKIAEIFSTHPNTVKRIRALQELKHTR